MILAIFAVLGAFAGEAQGAEPGTKGIDQVTSPGLASIRFDAPGHLQMEVWLSGRRLGITPFATRLEPGSYYLTACAEAIQPVMQPFEVKAKGDRMVVLPTAPVTAENLPDVVKQVIRTIQTTPANNHFTIISLHLATDPQDFQTLLGRADEQLPGDPIVDLLRARRLMKDQKINEALLASDRALKKLPRLAYAWRVRAEVLLASGDGKAALEAANEAVLSEPRGYRNVQVRAQVNAALNNPMAAKNDTEMADKLYDAMAEIPYQQNAPQAGKPR
ncbi:hypothetical protein IT570_07365 [Candidatus Sumerlaeota bacterium]|nr:hypothetical protein [Candidatus Sumerlaeota bacterium]